MHALCFDDISRRLTRTSPVCPTAPCDRKPAAVALILRENRGGLEMLLIERARHPEDPWSGNIGLPGGRRDPRDLDLRQTAERETMEEVGIDLRGAGYLGRLSDVVGANLPVRVACFVYGLTQSVEPVVSHEVYEAFWFGLEELWESQRHITAAVRFEGRIMEAPAIQLHPQRPVMWGITYRLVSQFRQILESGEEQVIPYELPL